MKEPHDLYQWAGAEKRPEILRDPIMADLVLEALVGKVFRWDVEGDVYRIDGVYESTNHHWKAAITYIDGPRKGKTNEMPLYGLLGEKLVREPMKSDAIADAALEDAEERRHAADEDHYRTGTGSD